MKKIAITLALALFITCLPTAVAPVAHAATKSGGDVAQPYASLYLSSYGGCTYNGDNDGRIYAEFHVIATDTMDVIGAKKIEIQEYYQSQTSDEGGWLTISVFDEVNAPDMLTSNTYIHGATVSCPRVPGRKYRAKITVYAGKDGKGDSRVYTTAYVVANPTP